MWQRLPRWWQFPGLCASAPSIHGMASASISTVPSVRIAQRGGRIAKRHTRVKPLAPLPQPVYADMKEIPLEKPDMAKTALPIGVQSFGTIRRQGLRYVDKTGFAKRLADRGKWYFLSRPRRFGKSLFISTLKELFEGNEKLFRGLAIHGQWDWSVRYPVIRLSFGAGNYAGKGVLLSRMHKILDDAAVAAGLSRWAVMARRIVRNAARSFGRVGSHELSAPDDRFTDLIHSLRRKFGRPVVVLVDEYDKPVLAAVDNPEVARENRDMLQSFYAVLKEEDDNIHFCFVTGVSRFSKVSLFSGANQLHDITLVPEYSAICGYTESDIDEVFSEELAGLDRDKVREWYNGYNWRGEESVYNPYGILLLLENREFKAWWFSTGTPTFLIDVMKQRGMFPIMLEDVVVSDGDLLVSDINSISAEALLFQSGYMTVVDEELAGDLSLYTLGYPNREVRQALNESLLMDLFPQPPAALAKNRQNLIRYLENGDMDKLKGVLHSMFAGIPHQWHMSSAAANYEAYFSSVVYGYFLGWGLDVRVEDSTSEGRIDLAVVASAHIYLFEFKVVNGSPEGTAIEQLRDRNYADKYRLHGKPIHLVGVEFSRETRNLQVFNAEPA